MPRSAKAVNTPLPRAKSQFPDALIFQYGSNCTAARLNGPSRLNGDAQDLGRAETIDEYDDIAFDVYSWIYQSAT